MCSGVQFFFVKNILIKKPFEYKCRLVLFHFVRLIIYALVEIAHNDQMHIFEMFLLLHLKCSKTRGLLWGNIQDNGDCLQFLSALLYRFISHRYLNIRHLGIRSICMKQQYKSIVIICSPNEYNVCITKKIVCMILNNKFIL